MRLSILLLSFLVVGSAVAQQAPVAMDDFFNTPADSTLTIEAPGILENDSGNEAFEAVLATPPSNGTLTLSPDGSFVYTPNAGYTGADTFSYYVLTLDVAEQFVVDPLQSGARLFADLDTGTLGTYSDNDSSSVTGIITAEVIPNEGPFTDMQVLTMDLLLADPLNLTFSTLVGSIVVTTDSDSLGLTLAEAGSPVIVSQGAFNQTGNQVAMVGRIDISATGLLANQVPSGPQQLNIAVPTDINGTIVQNESELTLSFPLDAQGSFDIDGNVVAVDLQGAVVATGPVVVRKQSNLATVAIVVQATGVGTETADGVAAGFELGQSFPNPADRTAAIAFSLPAASHVELAVYDALGRRVMTLVDAIRTEGTHRVAVDASALPAGMYFYRLAAGERSDMKKMIVLR